MPYKDPEKFRTAASIATILAGAITALLTKKKTRDTLYTMLAGWSAGILCFLVCSYSDKDESFTLIAVILVTGSISTVWPKLPSLIDSWIEFYRITKIKDNDRDETAKPS